MPALSEESKALRATRVGASEVGAVLAIDPYRGPMTVWERLTLGQEQEQSERMRIGSSLEYAIARHWAAETGERIRMNRKTRVRGNLAATADGFVTSRGGLLEVKWSNNAGLWADGPPPHIRAQCVAQSYVYRAQGKRITLVALIGGGIREWVIEPTLRERRELVREVDLFMERYVDTREMPIPMFPQELAVYLALLQGTRPAERRAATADEQNEGAAYVAARATARDWSNTANEHRERLLHLISADPYPRVIADGWEYRNDGQTVRIQDLSTTRKELIGTDGDE